MARASISEIIAVSVAARGESAAIAAPALVAALTEFLIICGPYVRAEMSLPAMVTAFDAGVAALQQAAGEAR